MRQPRVRTKHWLLCLLLHRQHEHNRLPQMRLKPRRQMPVRARLEPREILQQAQHRAGLFAEVMAGNHARLLPARVRFVNELAALDRRKLPFHAEPFGEA